MGRERIVIFGGGNIGRSFVGQIFARAGFEPVFIDVDRKLVAELNRHRSYTVEHRYPDGSEERLEIVPVRAVDGRDQAAVAEALAPPVRYVATSVGAAALPSVLPVLTREMARRGVPARHGDSAPAPLDIILAENIHGAGEIVRRAVPGAGVIECSVGKMVPLVPREVRERDIRTVYAEGFNTLIVDREGWKNPIPAVPELHPVAPIAAWIDRKLYIHNLGHATVAYLAFARNPTTEYIWQALEDRDVADRTRQIMESAAAGLLLEHPGVFTRQGLAEHIDDLLYRFTNRSLGDTLFRVGRDLERKLGPGDRVAGTLRMLQRHQCDTTPLEEVYRAALRFRARDDAGQPFPSDQALLDRLDHDKDQAHRILAEISGFNLEDPADRALVARLLPERE